ncbi:hypothetical protein PR048_001547 [Dryococelus australis]|uniref:Uncharacterized protein n=1 Tax=Dryococelus australis TaxID=614101 RepID=A0ABQ9IHU3_9NEOP|nr:hypothetical protein PR048_001547 [Dryococelus australis]
MLTTMCTPLRNMALYMLWPTCVTPISSLHADTPVRRLKSHCVSDVELCGLSLVQIYHSSDSSGCSKLVHGFMEKCFNNDDYKSTAVVPLPFVNLAPNNPSTIYTGLLYAAEGRAKLGKAYSMATFDQPLYAKACEMDFILVRWFTILFLDTDKTCCFPWRISSFSSIIGLNRTHHGWE